MEQHLYQRGGGGEGSVRGQEDAAEAGLRPPGVQEVVHQALQRGGRQPAHLAGAVLDEVVAWARGGGALGGGRGHRLPVEGDTVDHALLLLLAPRLDRVLGGRGERESGERDSGIERVGEGTFRLNVLYWHCGTTTKHLHVLVSP